VSVIQNTVDVSLYQDVENNTWKLSEREVLDSEFLGSCIGVAVYDSYSQTGALGHFETIGNEELGYMLEEFLEEAERKMGRSLEVLAGGTMSPNLDPLETDPGIEEGRETAEDVINQYFDSAMYDWHDGFERSRMAVHPEYGIFYQEKV